MLHVTTSRNWEIKRKINILPTRWLHSNRDFPEDTSQHWSVLHLNCFFLLQEKGNERVTCSCSGQCTQKRGRGACTCKTADLNCANACKCVKSKCKKHVWYRSLQMKVWLRLFIYPSSSWLEIIFDSSNRTKKPGKCRSWWSRDRLEAEVEQSW